MRKRGEEILYSASDLVNYLECEHLTTLDLDRPPDTACRGPQDSDEARLIPGQGLLPTRLTSSHLAQGLGIPRMVPISPPAVGGNARTEGRRHAIQAMRAWLTTSSFRRPCSDGCLIGHADFLRKVPHPIPAWPVEL
jgi:hypothetical protein